MLLLNRRRYMHASNDVIMTAATNPEVLAICYAQGWCASADKMTKSEAEQVTDIAQVFRASNIVHFDELAYFTSLTAIPDRAFQECASLTSIAIPEGVTSIGFRSFYNDALLVSLTLPSTLTTITQYAFERCYALALTELPSSLTTIGQSAFLNCYALAISNIPSSVASIGASAFYFCRSMTITTIPSGITAIADQTFRSCQSIPTMTLPSGVTTIGTYVFNDCSSMTEIVLPSSVTSIGDCALRYAVRLQTIRCNATTAPSLGTSVFENTGASASGTKQLIVPIGASGYDAGDWLTLQTTYGYNLIYE